MHEHEIFLNKVISTCRALGREKDLSEIEEGIIFLKALVNSVGCSSCKEAVSALDLLGKANKADSSYNGLKGAVKELSDAGEKLST